MKNRLLLLAALIAGLALVGPAHAQDRGGTVSRVQFDLDGWLYVPTLSSSGARVESFVALRLDGTQTGENITSVWFRRGSNAWRVVAWENSQLQAQVIRHVKDALAIADRYDYLWPIPPAAESAAEPLVFANGVLADDAMRVAIESGSDPRGFLSDLVQAGYKAALLEPEIVDLAQQCVEHDVLNISRRELRSSSRKPKRREARVSSRSRTTSPRSLASRSAGIGTT